jgi:hypothetical protein
MQTNAKSIHAIEVLNCCSVMLKIPVTVDATMAKSINNGLQILWCRNGHSTSETCSATDFMKKHAHQFIGHIGLCTACGASESFG